MRLYIYIYKNNYSVHRLHSLHCSSATLQHRQLWITKYYQMGSLRLHLMKYGSSAWCVAISGSLTKTNLRTSKPVDRDSNSTMTSISHLNFFILMCFTVCIATSPILRPSHRTRKNSPKTPLTGKNKEETSGRVTEEGSLFQDGQACNRCCMYRMDGMQFMDRKKLHGTSLMW